MKGYLGKHAFASGMILQIITSNTSLKGELRSYKLGLQIRYATAARSIVQG